MELNINKMNGISVTSYLNAPEAFLYRTIMRILYREKESYNSQLSTDDIFLKLRNYEGHSEVSMEKLKLALSQLTAWGCLLPMQDPRRVKTIEEYQNKIYRYSLTEEAVIVERMTIELENMFSEGTTLSSSLLSRIDNVVSDIPFVMDTKSGQELNEWWKNLREDFRRLSTNYSDYLHSFCSVKGEKLISSVEFLLHKDKFIEYLRNFITQLQRYSVKIENNLKKLSSERKNRLLEKLVESEQKIPRTNYDTQNSEDIKNKIYTDWNSLYQWFVSESGRESVCNNAMEYTNDIIRKMVNNAVLLMELQSSGISKKHEYQKYMQMFADCQNMDEAHCLSAHIFGVMNVFHYKFNTEKETDMIFSNACDVSPQIFVIKPVTRNYKPRIKTDGVVLRTEEKKIYREKKLEKTEYERKMIEKYIIDNQLCVDTLKEDNIQKQVRITLLKWITSAMQNRSRTGITDFGRKFRMITSDRYVTVNFDDGSLLMPSYTFVFGEE